MKKDEQKIRIMDEIYDKLMDNTMREQFNPNKSSNEWVDDETGTLHFEYEGSKFELSIKRIQTK